MASDDARWLGRAIELACLGVERGAGGPFGAVVVWQGQVIGEAHNEVLRSNDPTAHAEVVAIRRACERIARLHLEGAVLYASCEPCPMCLGAACWAHVARVAFAATRDDAAAAGFDDARLYEELARPPGQRELATAQQGHPDAQQPFARWSAWQDRILY